MKRLWILYSLIWISLAVQAQHNRTITINSKKIKVYDPYYKQGKLLLKGQLHTHTTNSDGLLSPQQVANFYDSLGYDFYTITDHNAITKDPQNPNLIWMGESYEHTHWTKFHACVYHAKKVLPIQDNFDSTYAGMKQAHKHSLMSLAHPDWQGLYLTDLFVSNITQLDFVEVAKGTGDEGVFTSRALDSLLSNKKYVKAVATDDFHNYSYYTNSWIEVHANRKTARSIWRGIIKGAFYATKGARMNMNLSKEGILYVTTPIASTIRFIGKNGVVLHTATNVTEALYTIVGNETYIRCEVVDVYNKPCWSQAILLTDYKKQ